MATNLLLLALVAALSILIIVPVLLLIDAYQAAAYEKLSASFSTDVKTPIPQFQDPYLARYPETYLPRLMTEVKTPIVLPSPPPRRLSSAEKRMIRTFNAASPAERQQAVMSMAKLIMMRHESRRSNRPRTVPVSP
jgi:hypothetical protein